MLLHVNTVLSTADSKQDLQKSKVVVVSSGNLFIHISQISRTRFNVNVPD